MNESEMNLNEMIYLAHQKDPEAIELIYSRFESLALFYWNQSLQRRLSFLEWKSEVLQCIDHCINRYREDQRTTFSSMLHRCLGNRVKDLVRGIYSKYYVDCEPVMSLDYTLADSRTPGWIVERSADFSFEPSRKVMEKQMVETLFELWRKELCPRDYKIMEMMYEGYQSYEIRKLLDLPSMACGRALNRARRAAIAANLTW